VNDFDLEGNVLPVTDVSLWRLLLAHTPKSSSLIDSDGAHVDIILLVVRYWRMDGVLLAFCGGLATIQCGRLLRLKLFFLLRYWVSSSWYLTAKASPPSCSSWWYCFETSTAAACSACHKTIACSELKLALLEMFNIGHI